MTSNLKPCPFCGDAATYGSDSDLVRVVCSSTKFGCAATTQWYDEQEDAAAAWNTRPHEDALLVRIVHMKVISAAQDKLIAALKEWGRLVVMNKDTELAERVASAALNLDNARAVLQTAMPEAREEVQP